MYKSIKLSLFLILIIISNMSMGEELPKDIKWITNNNEPVFSDYKPVKGGEFRDYINSYPQTFRLYGPNSNSGGFVSYNRKWSLWSLVTRHNSTNNHIPFLASHWAIMPDQKTVYYKLDQDAKWSDGEKITSDDYLFAFEFLQSPHIQAPFYNQYIRDHIAEVVKIDDYTLKIVGTKKSWRVLDDLDLTPIPKHAIKLDEDWVKSSQWVKNVVPGPYVIGDFQKGKYIKFNRIKDWWGYDKKYFKNSFNFDTIRLDVIQTEETAYEQFKKGQLTIFNPTPLVWINKTDIDEINKGYIVKRRIFYNSITGARGLFFNTQSSIWSDKNLRKAFAYTIDFESLNKNFFHGLFVRKHNYFDVLSPYKIENIKTYPYDISKSNRILDDTNWERNPKTGFREINGQKLQLTIITGSDEALRYLPYIKETAARAGIEVLIRKSDGAQFFDIVNNRKYQNILISFGGGLFPSPRQMLHTENIAPNTNNLFMFGTEQIDEWIDQYDFDLDENIRINSIKYIELAVRDNVLFVPFWKEPAERILYWRYIKGPKEFIYKNGSTVDLWYFDQAEKAKLDNARKNSDDFKIIPIEFDPYNLY